MQEREGGIIGQRGSSTVAIVYCIRRGGGGGRTLLGVWTFSVFPLSFCIIPDNMLAMVNVIIWIDCPL